MISQNAFTRYNQIELEQTPLRAEMSVISEWIVRDDRFPDLLLTVYVAPFPSGTIFTACSCDRGARNEPCPHALKVVREIEGDAMLLRELFKPKPKPMAYHPDGDAPLGNAA